MARTGSLKLGVTEVECARNVPSPFDYADRFWGYPSWAAPVSRSPSLRSAGAIVAPALVLAFPFQCTSPHKDQCNGVATRLLIAIPTELYHGAHA
ncbi:unnamed protein product [Phytophthora fragariaefolia]|uniref:Unnamed protein product n=1 Tax=Phytophthora fragariaefolia TaxID=1490495 RepID=A0A9W6XX75_9STRA|nr:unnamed protein product [Phytophthora fragariaefolia]